MGVLDKEIILKHLKEIETALLYLKRKKGLSEKELIKDIEQRYAIERAFHLAIQNLIDIGNHILASLNINEIETYSDIPAKLATANIISAKLAGNLINMAKFRNILVHEYIKIEAKKLISFLHNNLGDFEDFASAIVKHLNK